MKRTIARFKHYVQYALEASLTFNNLFSIFLNIIENTALNNWSNITIHPMLINSNMFKFNKLNNKKRNLVILSIVDNRNNINVQDFLHMFNMFSKYMREEVMNQRLSNVRFCLWKFNFNIKNFESSWYICDRNFIHYNGFYRACLIDCYLEEHAVKRSLRKSYKKACDKVFKVKLNNCEVVNHNHVLDWYDYKALKKIMKSICDVFHA
jgi:hypothetical protein